MELKQILARQPGPEVAEQLSMYQSTAKEKTKQMKVNQINLSVCYGKGYSLSSINLVLQLCPLLAGIFRKALNYSCFSFRLFYLSIH